MSTTPPSTSGGHPSEAEHADEAAVAGGSGQAELGAAGEPGHAGLGAAEGSDQVGSSAAGDLPDAPPFSALHAIGHEYVTDRGAAPEHGTWQALLAAANAAAQRAYAPYSTYHVGAAAYASDGRLVTGCNVENAGLGVTLCAECGLISDLINGGGGTIDAFVCVNGHGDIITPCGRCRQLLNEHATDNSKFLMPTGVMTMDQLMPGAFGPRQYAEGQGTQ